MGSLRLLIKIILAFANTYRARLSDEMDTGILDAIAKFMDANKVAYKWKKVISLNWHLLFSLRHYC